MFGPKTFLYTFGSLPCISCAQTIYLINMMLLHFQGGGAVVLFSQREQGNNARHTSGITATVILITFSQPMSYSLLLQNLGFHKNSHSSSGKVAATIQ